MQKFQRAFALFSIVAVGGFFAGCGGQGSPIPGSSSPAEEAANAALAPEGGLREAATSEATSEAGGAAAETTAPAAEAQPAAESPEAASAPE